MIGAAAPADCKFEVFQTIDKAIVEAQIIPISRFWPLVRKGHHSFQT
jgi:hypothetical protein